MPLPVAPRFPPHLCQGGEQRDAAERLLEARRSDPKQSNPPRGGNGRRHPPRPLRRRGAGRAGHSHGGGRGPTSAAGWGLAEHSHHSKGWLTICSAEHRGGLRDCCCSMLHKSQGLSPVIQVTMCFLYTKCAKLVVIRLTLEKRCKILKKWS